MNRNYKVSHIRKALDAFEQKFPERQTIGFAELELITKKLQIPAIYNLEVLIRLLTDYINENRLRPQLYRESEVCKILNVRKLTMHQWRKNSNITYLQGDTRTIRYNLETLLADLKKNRHKNISVTRL
jgi:hypothetical protein